MRWFEFIAENLLQNHVNGTENFLSIVLKYLTMYFLHKYLSVAKQMRFSFLLLTEWIKVLQCYYAH